MTGIDLKAQCKQEILIENLNSHLWRTLTWSQTLQIVFYPPCAKHCSIILVNNQWKVGFPWLLKIIFLLWQWMLFLCTPLIFKSFVSSLTFFLTTGKKTLYHYGIETKQCDFTSVTMFPRKMFASVFHQGW